MAWASLLHVQYHEKFSNHSQNFAKPFISSKSRSLESMSWRALGGCWMPSYNYMYSAWHIYISIKSWMNLVRRAGESRSSDKKSSQRFYRDIIVL